MKTALLVLTILLLTLPRAIHAQSNYFLQIHFESKRAELSLQELTRLDSALSVLRAKPFRYRVDITGHADSSGNSRQNYYIALKRAETCSALLEEKGFLKKNIHLNSKGSAQPIYTNNNEFGKSINRRVDISFTELPLEQPLRKVDRLSEVLQQKQFKVSAEKGGRVKYSSGTELIIPAKAFVDANGNEIKGNVSVSYVEMRDPIDIALSDIEMMHEHNGEVQVMNSGGMFRVLASQNGRPVYLNRDSSIGVNFALAQRIPDLNFYTYDSITRKWTEQRKLTGRNGQSLRPRADDYYSPDFRRYNSYCAMPEFESYLFKVNTGIRMADSKVSLYQRLMNIDTVGALRALARSDSATSEVKKMSQFITFKQLELAKAKHAYRIELLNNHDSIYSFNIVCRGNTHNELENFKKVHWQLALKGENKALLDLCGRSWTLCEISEGSNGFSIVFKNQLRTITLKDVHLAADRGIGRSEQASYYQSLNTQYTIRYQKYLQHLDNLQAEIDSAKEDVLVKDEAAQHLKKACNKFNWYYDRIFSDSLYCFWAEHLTVMSPPERSMRFENWLQYYDSHRQQYLGMYTRMKKSAKYAYCKSKDRQYRYYLALREAELGSIGQQNAMVESLQIRQLGICNIDALMRYNLSNQGVVAFKDASGKKIDIQNVRLIDSEINSAIPFYDLQSPNSVEMRFNAQSENAVLVFDVANNLYVCGKSAFRKGLSSAENTNVEMTAMRVPDKRDKAQIRRLMQ